MEFLWTGPDFRPSRPLSVALTTELYCPETDRTRTRPARRWPAYTRPVQSQDQQTLAQTTLAPSEGEGPRSAVPERTEAPLSPSQERVRKAMTGLLARAGLEYRGGFVNLPGGMRVHYLDYGPIAAPDDADAPVVILVHGGGAGSAMWYRQIAALSARFRVIAPDNPLFGLSTQTSLSWPIEDSITGYMTSFMDALGLKNVLFAGLSLGGFAGLLMAARHPERISKLAVLDAAGLGRDLPWPLKFMSLPVAGRLLSNPSRRTYRSFFRRWEVERPGGPDAEAYEEYSFAIMRQDGHNRAIAQTVPAFASLAGQRRLISDAELATVSAPTLIVWGARDRLFPVSHARRAFENIPGAMLQILPDTGHVTLWDAPEQVTELLTGFFSDGWTPPRKSIATEEVS